jgi:hypothetical protein
MLDGAIEEALLAVDLYNRPRQPRRLEAFLVHMHMAWLYLLQAEFRQEGTDFHYRLSNGRFERVDGEPKTWDLQRSVCERWPDGGPVRLNIELTIALRNKIEHRFHEAIELATSGYAQALVMNFEEELTERFGAPLSLGNQLRFPIFVGDITPLGEAQGKKLTDLLPTSTRDFLARFEASIDSATANDQRYEFRLTLVPTLAAKTSADRSLKFVREDDLTDTEKTLLQNLGKSGSVVIREQIRSVANADKLTPSEAVDAIQKETQFNFHMGHFVRAWKALKCRPQPGDQRPDRTDERYCVYDARHNDYLYTDAFVARVVAEIDTADSFALFLGLPARPA